MSRFGRTLLLLSSILTLVLVACIDGDLDQTITFFNDGQWQLETDVIIAETDLPTEEAVDEFELLLRTTLAESVTDNASYEISNRREDAHVIYTISVEGDNIQLLAEALGGGVEIVDEERIQLRLRPDMDFNNRTYTIVGSEIISGNGIEVESGVMQWNNPTSMMEAVIVGKGNFPLSTILGIVALVAIGVGGWFVWQKGLVKMPTRQPTASPPIPPVQQCHNCATTIDGDAPFCANCGEAITPVTLPSEPASANHCPNCQTVIDDDAAFCLQCGTKLSD